jgi:hypothetical protein
MFAANVVLLTMLAFTYPALEPGTTSYVVAQLSLVFIGASLLGLYLVIRVDWRPFD